MKAVAALCIVLCCLYSQAQQSAVKGIVSIHNSETKTGKRQYVTNAEIEDDFGKATPRLTDNQGRFILMYVGIPEKATVSFQVKKTGLQVVDQTALSAVAGQASEVKISMAYPDSINEYRRKIFQVGKTEAEKRLERLVESNAKELVSLRKNETQNAEQIKKLEAAMAMLDEQSKRITDQAEALARKYAPLNLDDAPKLFRSAFFLFQKGYFDSAYQLLQQANLDGRVDAILVERKKIVRIQEELKQRDSVAVLNTDDARQALELKADFHETKYEFDSAAHCYEQLIRLDTANGNYLLAYSKFLSFLNSYDKALLYANKALAAFRKGGKEGKELKDAGIAKTDINIGNIYSKRAQYAKAEIPYDEALAISKRLAKANPRIYEDFVASVLNNMGTHYSNKRDFARSQAAYLDAIKLYTKLAKKDSLTYKPKIAYAQAGLGVMYRFKSDFDKAKAVLSDAMQTYQQLVKDNPALYQPVLATTEDELGNVYTTLNSFDTAETLLQSSLQIRRQLAQSSPQVYQSYVAVTLTNLGSLYSYINNLGKAETALLQALEIYKQLIKDNPQVYEASTANTQSALAILYSKNGDAPKAEAAYASAIGTYQKLAVDNPQVYDGQIANALYNQGTFYSYTGNYAKAETALLNAHSISTRLAKADVKMNGRDLALINASLGDLYKNKAEYAKAETLLQEAISMYQQLTKGLPGMYEPYLANTQSKLGDLYQQKGDSLQAEATYNTSIQTYKALAKKNPQAYEPELTIVSTSLINLYINRKNYPQAEKLLTETWAIEEKWMASYSQVYTAPLLKTAEYMAVLYTAMPATTAQQQASIKKAEDRINQLIKAKKISATQLANYYGNTSWDLCMATKFSEAERYARKGIAADKGETWIQINLAHALLFQNKYPEALKLYKELKQMKMANGSSMAIGCLTDLDALEKAGITNKEVGTIKAALQ